MNKLGTVLLASLVLAFAAYHFSAAAEPQQNIAEMFDSWKKEHGVTYSAAEDAYRYEIFVNNLAEVLRHNSDSDRTYDKGINKFSAMTQKEFAATYLSPKPYNPEWETVDETFHNLGADVDWTAKGAVSPVKDQGNCGSCWAFSAVGVLESFSLMNGIAVSLSEQQLVDCSRKYGNFGCGGGFNYEGLAYVKDHGITDTTSYPYVAHNQGCKIDGGNFKIKNVPSAKGCTAIQTAIASRPIGVSVDANNWSHYASGIFNNCGKSLDHDVLLVGMTGTYWKIKNSWGANWGENGFIRLATGNTCGICNDKSPWVE